MDFEGPFSWYKARKQTWLKIIECLGNLSALNRAQLMDQGSHAYQVVKCSKAARDRFVELGLDATHDSVFSLRVEGRLRIICIEHWPILDQLWFDCNHEVFPSLKKNT